MMFQVVSSLLLLSLFSVGQGNSKNLISVSNGGEWGEWGPVEMCPVGSHARGFSLKVERFQWFGDDTSLNGIRLHCVSSINNGEYSIQSTEGDWGSWTSTFSCHTGFLIAFSLRAEPRWIYGDDHSAASNIMFKCSDQSVIKGSGNPWGSYGDWSESCEIGICGIRTKVQVYQSDGDDTALNDVKFSCCRN
ncbi:vitelline membrane outer layer protein 1-like [Ascaphus truei]|uniref:vitelline membrane outer layer protein 1-like n=1 Tax=Ascaphus truei TaxID=8439 RepID=UPI003F59BEC1